MHIAVVDIIILVLLLGSFLRGRQIGFIRQLSSTTAFVIGLYPGSMLSSWVMTYVSGPTKPLVGLAVILAVSFTLMTIAEFFAAQLKVSIKNRFIQGVDNGFGAIIAVITLLLGIWLAGALFQLAPSSSLQTAIKDSNILGTLNRKLPPINSVLSSLNKLIDPNQSPQVFAGREPSPSSSYALPDTSAYATMLAQARTSVVKVEGLGCGGLVDGSGFVYSLGRIATNAHVVAGVRSPKVIDANGTHNATVVWFDANNDIAVLSVTDLAGNPLPLDTNDTTNGTPVFALGYPGGGNYTVQPGVVQDQFIALGQDIYGQQRTTRTVYSVQANIVPGNSGGPLVDVSGKVRGIVFATSTTYNNVGYALTSRQVSAQLKQAASATTSQSTGQCSE